MNTTRRQYLQSSLGLGLAFWGSGICARTESASLVWREKIFQGLGTTLWIRAGHSDERVLESALEKSVQAVRQVERSMSLFDENSALSQLNRDGVLLHPHPDLLKVLTLSQSIAQKSAGAFDVTMQPIWLAWSNWLQKQGIDGVEGTPPLLKKIPSDLRANLTQACERVGWKGLAVSAESVRLQPGMAVSLNGIAQGYASDAAKAALQRSGIQHAILDVGETSFLGQSAQGPWTVGLESVRGHEHPPVWVSDGRAIATSSEAHTAFSADRRYHHIVNPMTGYSPTYWASVSVMAPSCALADGLTKVFFMLPPDKIQSHARFWGVDVLLQDKQGKWHRHMANLV